MAVRTLSELRRGAPGLRPALPRRLQVEVTGACNLRCRMCLVRYRHKIDREEGAFPYDRFVALLDELPHLEQVTLQGLGEPLLHPDLVAMVAEAKRRGLRVGFNTNGTLLTPANAEALVAAGTDWMHVSMDGATAATFEHIRDGAHFDQVRRNLRRLVAVRSRLGSPTPSIQLNVVLMRSNVHELDDLVRLAADIGVDRLWLQALSHDFSDTDQGDEAYVEIRSFAQAEGLWSGEGGGADGTPSGPPLGEVLARARRLAQGLGVELRLPEDGPPDELAAAGDGAPLPCDWPWTSAYVTHDGKVQPCCMVMGDDRVVLGHIDDDGGLAGVWHGEAYRRFRRELASDRPPAVCRGCSLYRHVF